MIKHTGRVVVIDSMRGFSLVGILLANMLIFQYGIWGKDTIEFFSLSAPDTAAYLFLKIVVEGSFMPIFTFLFGYSMIKMKESLERKNLKVKRYFIRRFLLLFTLGILHGTFLWEGDILTFYGMMGFFLLIFLNRKLKTVMIWTVLFLLISTLAGYGAASEGMEGFINKQTLLNYVKDSVQTYGSGTYEQVKDFRNNADPLELPEYMFLVFFLLSPLATAALFLLGMYAAKKNWFYELRKEKQLYRTTAIILIPLSLLLKSSYYLFPNAGWAGSAHMLGANLLSVGYIFGFAWLFTNFKRTILMKAFECVGKLSLSNYLLQTVICTTIFYGYGFGYFGKLGVIPGIALCLGIYGLQLAGSYVYLKYFTYGPVEKVLRMWTNFSWSGKAKIKVALPVEAKNTSAS
ncbi:DUF418 domain-containing protein [Bacillus sp. 03113]|uniref:DUF418 domain-containing protein n=1 Tax=Bacillus sp. 03113 TaxID=2578211 RepID=UPI001143A295|nr:DUF418 domain-containing protein [Bacillus sp. 03113]